MNDAQAIAVESEPADVGMSAAGLDKITASLAAQAARGEIPGAVAAVHRAGRLCWLGVAGDASADSIFRIYSMTKPLTSAAAMSLVQDGLLDLTDPAGKYLPELAELRVFGDDPEVTVPAERPVTVHDLLRHTAGFVGGYRGSARASEAYARAGISEFDHTPTMAEEYTSADLVAALASLPLAHQPGTAWEYGRSGDVLGRLLEAAAGQPLGEIMRDRVCGPAGMHETGFFVPAEHEHRIVQPLVPFTADTKLVNFTSPPAFESGGSGAYSTAGDYLRFGLMVLGKGELGGERVAPRKLVELMTADHLGPLAGTGPDYIPGPGYGFGFGFAVRTSPGMSPMPGSAGDLWWLGRAATCFFVDPQEELVAVMLTQRYWEARRFQAWFKALVCQAIVD